jgi:DNA-binding IclR family transcriptional regulator
VVAETSQTLDRGLRVLDRVAQRPDGCSVVDLAEDLGVGRTVVYRLLSTLEAHQLVRRDRQGRVWLGTGALRLAGRVVPLLREAALPALRALAEDVGATAHLTVVDGGDALAVAVAEPTWTDFHVAYRVGSRHPLRQGAAGLALLAGASDGAGAVGAVVSHGELQPGATGVAAPVDGLVAVRASVGVVALGPVDADRVGPRVEQAAAQVAAAFR